MRLSLLAVAASVLFAGCVAQTEQAPDSAETDGDELSTTGRTYVALRPDMRKCISPLCGGYFVHDVNRKAEHYVSGLDFGPSGFDDDTIAKVQSAPASELVLRGKLGPAEPKFHTRMLLVYEAYRGMPGVTPVDGEVFFKAHDRNPPIQCFTAPCDNEVARKLNTTATYSFTSFSMQRVAAPFLDLEWLTEQTRHHDAIVVGKIRNGTLFQGGYEKVLDSSQVFIRLPYEAGPCPMGPIKQCDPNVAAFDRNADRCMIFQACVKLGICPLYMPHCTDGYTLAAWRTEPNGCFSYACDPSFTVQ